MGTGRAAGRSSGRTGGDRVRAPAPAPAPAAAGGSTQRPLTLAGLDSAFRDSPGGGRENFVFLAELRDRLGGTRQEQDQLFRQGVIADRFTFNTHDGAFDALTDRQISAAFFSVRRPEGRFLNPNDGQRYDQMFALLSRVED